jgi:hypothetical protein
VRARAAAREEGPGCARTRAAGQEQLDEGCAK